jgi:TPR repeat protein
MSTASPQPHDLWRVAALSMMARDKLSAALQGEGAAAWVKAAANCGFAEAQVRLERMKLEGDGVARDADGRNMLGRCYENGWGTAKDHVRAAHHYRIASEAGLDWAHYNLGHMLLSGRGVARDRDAAFACYAKAAAKGHIRAMNLVGRCYEEGWGVTRDPDAARDWYRRSAFGGYFRGAYNYADKIAAEGCIHSALPWFKCALDAAPEPTRGAILKSLAARPHPAFRALAASYTASRSSGCATST